MTSVTSSSDSLPPPSVLIACAESDLCFAFTNSPLLPVDTRAQRRELKVKERLINPMPQTPWSFDRQRITKLRKPQA
jgi:hypothetical protein